LNASLERRVDEQVSEIKERAADIERLNAQLHAQVRERSRELADALARLAEQRSEDPSVERGRILGGRFEIAEFLGEGGMGSVYAGVDRTTGDRVAIKITRARSIAEFDALQRFVREAGTAAAVTHPAVVAMIHVDIAEDGLLYQVQELIEGDTLQSRGAPGRTWSPVISARLVSVLCEGLAAAHAKNVIHRDVKPSNVMITRAVPGLKLVDFGIAKVFADAQGAGDSTMTGLILGTPAYMAPEQLDGVRDLTDRADVYAVGVMLFQLLTGRHPADAQTGRRPVGIERRVRNADPRVFESEVPAALADLVASCLATDPTQRPSAATLARSLANFADTSDRRALEILETEGLLRGTRDASSALQETVAARRVTPN
jgi:serine/threonine protein kinase